MTHNHKCLQHHIHNHIHTIYHPIQMWMNEKWLVILAHVQLFYKKERNNYNISKITCLRHQLLSLFNDTIDKDEEMMWIILHKLLSLLRILFENRLIPWKIGFSSINRGLQFSLNFSFVKEILHCSLLIYDFRNILSFLSFSYFIYLHLQKRIKDFLLV